MKRTSILSLVLVGMVVISGTAFAVSFNDGAPNPYLDSTVEKSSHDMAEHSVTEYEGDSGDTQSLDAKINPNSDNPISFTATDIDFDAGQFPVKTDESNNEFSTLDGSEWTVGTQVAASDAKPAEGVAAVNIATDGTMTSGDVASATYSNFSITNDENKKYITLIADINQLDSGATVNLNVVDADGDSKVIRVDPSADQFSEDVVATSTGDGAVFQAQLGELSTVTGGDGTFDDIEEIRVTATDADADITFTHLSVDRTKPIQFGETSYDSDGDGETDATQQLENVPAGQPVMITSLDTMGAEFDAAVINNLNVDLRFGAEHLPDDDVRTDATETDQYPGYDYVVDFEYRLNLPTAYDLSHSNTELATETQHPGERYLTVEYAEGVGDTEFDSIDYNNDVTAQFGAEGQTVSLDSLVAPGDEIAVHTELKLTASEWESMQSDSSAVGPVGGGDGGLGSIPLIGGILVVLTGVYAKIRRSA